MHQWSRCFMTKVRTHVVCWLFTFSDKKRKHLILIWNHYQNFCGKIFANDIQRLFSFDEWWKSLIIERGFFRLLLMTFSRRTSFPYSEDVHCKYRCVWSGIFFKRPFFASKNHGFFKKYYTFYNDYHFWLSLLLKSTLRLLWFSTHV